MSVQGHTAAALLCRKILMHVAVEKKANPNQTFVEYVDFLASQHIIPAGSKAWVDHIRTRPNLENHEVVIINRDEAEGLIKFTEMLLKIVYEYPAKVPTGGSSPPAAS
jgi:hypothetical protein